MRWSSLLPLLAACATRTPTATLPAPPPPGEPPRVAHTEGPLRVLVGTCNDQDEHQDYWDQLRAADPDLAILAGDNIYADVVLDANRKLLRFEGSPERVAAAYTKQAAVPGFQAFRAAVPVLATWDDHDYGYNDAGAELAFKAESQSLFLDFWGAGPDDERRARPGVYTSAWAKAGDLDVQILLLDVRSFRSPLQTAPEGTPTPHGRYVPSTDPSATMLGDAQWAWLGQRLAEPADVRLIVSGTQVLAEGHGFERWGNLPAERQRLLDLIGSTGAAGVVLLSGDRHFGEILLDDTDVPYPMWELSSSSLNKSFGGRPDEPHPLRVGPQVAAENHGLVTLDPVARTLHLALRTHDGAEVTSQTVPLSALTPP